MKATLGTAKIFIWKTRWMQIFRYGRRDSAQICQELGKNIHSITRVRIFLDILFCYLRYSLWSNQYKAEKFFLLSNKERSVLGMQYKGKNNLTDLLCAQSHMDYMIWLEDYFENRRFLSKYSSMRYDTSAKLIEKRNNAYRVRYNMGKDNYIQCGVTIIREHLSTSQILIGEKIVIARDVDIDYTGGLVIGNGVDISEGVKILTHGHSFVGNMYDDILIPNTNRAYKTPLVIEDNVLIGARSIIMPGVKRIGENSIISVGSLVSKPVPPNCIVAGNPAKVIYEMPEGYRVYFKYKRAEQ